MVNTSKLLNLHQGERIYEVIAIQVPIVYNFDGDHDHDGMIFALQQHRQHLEQIRENFEQFAKTPDRLVRPLVLRACKGDTVKINFTNHLQNREVGIHLVSDGYSVQTADGAAVGINQSSLVPPGQTREYIWKCHHEGVFPFHDMGNLSGGEDGTNAHGLFGALIVEPEGAWWSDPEMGDRLDKLENGLDGLYVDVHLRSPENIAQIQQEIAEKVQTGELNEEQLEPPKKYADARASFREFVIFFHDEPHFVPAHEMLEPNPCSQTHGAEVGHSHGDGSHEPHHPIMPISYRAEPMINRERRLWRMIREGTLKKPVIGEEQHHSSWLFGDPATPILKAYVSDPVRIRLVHAGVKETHVFHLHVYQWHAIAENDLSPLIDSISISPQTGHTIVPLWGAGSRQGAIGDVIWHCHLYPHFHEGMWGMFRTFDRRQDGEQNYPDGKQIAPLVPLPDRIPPPRATKLHPGFPNFIPGEFGQKSPVPPWPYLDRPMPSELDYRLVPTQLEISAFNDNKRPGELFNRFPFPSDAPLNQKELAVLKTRIDYNDNGWHDPDGHVFVLSNEATPDETGRRWEPLYFRAHQGDVLELSLENRLPVTIAGTAFDLPLPPCDVYGVPLAECGLHVHLVKFDPLVADGASTGWNYMSGAQSGKKMIYRWWVDEEFGTVFFHDHLFANYRQKHGLFGAMIAQEKGAEFLDPYTHRASVSGAEAIIKLPDGRAFREFCFGLADFVPLFDRDRNPLNPPNVVGGHGDQGVMAVNYRCEPIRQRKGDPAFWFYSRRHQYTVKAGLEDTEVTLHHGDPVTNIFESYPGEPIRLRLVQGSHEEQHSFQVHGMRWRQFGNDPDSPLRNQQTIGISEAFTFNLEEKYGAGDYLWKLSSADDLWLGCWGLIRVHSQKQDYLPLLKNDISNFDVAKTYPRTTENTRRFRIVAEHQRLVYRDRDLVDPFGLVYRLEQMATPNGDWTEVPLDADRPFEPLILRCRAGEWVEIELANNLPQHLEPEPFAPQVPLEDPNRQVSRHVSLHSDLLLYDIRESDGANVGRNPLQSAAPGEIVKYLWYADQDLGPILLQDMADFRYHRHHGLVGALIVEAADAQPDRWYGAQSTIEFPQSIKKEEVVLLLQDGLRFYLNGNTAFPIPDIPADPGEERPDPEDQGQKAFNYRSEPVGEPTWLQMKNPATPIWKVSANSEVLLRLVIAADKPRNHSFTIHGHTWAAYPYMKNSPRFAAISALSTGTVDTFYLTTASETGDYAYRTGVFKWALSQGLWGIFRITD